MLVGDQYVGTLIGEQPDHRLVPITRRDVQRRLHVIIDDRNVSTPIDEEAGKFQVPQLACREK